MLSSTRLSMVLVSSLLFGIDHYCHARYTDEELKDMETDFMAMKSHEWDEAAKLAKAKKLDQYCQNFEQATHYIRNTNMAKPNFVIKGSKMVKVKVTMWYLGIAVSQPEVNSVPAIACKFPTDPTKAYEKTWLRNGILLAFKDQALLVKSPRINSTGLPCVLSLFEDASKSGIYINSEHCDIKLPQ